MSQAPVISDSPPYTLSNRSNKFARIDNNPNVRNAQYYAPPVYGSQSHHNPEFNKSPLTSIEMYRKTRNRSLPINDAPGHIVQESPMRHDSHTDCDWKSILLWGLIALALLALAVGVFFLIRAAILTDNKDHDNLRSYTPPDVPPTPPRAYSGINPIYVSPVPYSNMQVPTISGYLASPTQPEDYTYVTQPSTTYSTQPAPPVTQQSYSPPTLARPITEPTVTWMPDSSEAYVNPVDVYRHNHE